MSNTKRNFLKTALLLGAGAAISPVQLMASASGQNNSDQISNADLFNPDLNLIRKLSNTIAGELPTALNIIRIADTTRPANIVVRGESKDRDIKLERTAYQLEYTNGTIMLDSGMDEATHHHFGKGGNFYPSYAQLQAALKKANLIVLSHYHGDHVAGVVCSPHFDDIAHKVWLSQKDRRPNGRSKPHKPTLNISQEQVNRFIICDYERYMPIAPGLVAIKAPGHSLDSTMFYVRLKSGQEFLHSVDTGWSMENIIKSSMKNAPWIKENEKQIMAQFAWLTKLMTNELGMIVLCAHDTRQYTELRKMGVLGDLKV